MNNSNGNGDDLKHNLNEKKDNYKDEADFINSFVGMYQAVYYLDLIKDTYIEKGVARAHVEGVIGNVGSISDAMERMCKYLVVPSQAEEMRKFVDMSTLQDRLKDRYCINREFFGTIGKWSVGEFIVAQRDENGVCTKAIWAVRDIDDKKVMELEYKRTLENHLKEMAAMNELLSEYNDIMSSAGYGIWKCSIDENGYINGMTGNDKFRDIYGIKNEEMTAQECLKYFVNGLINKEDDPCQFNYFEFDLDINARKVFLWNHPQKGEIYIEIAGSKHTDLNGNINVSGYAIDVTDKIITKQKWENDIIEAKRQAEEASKAKTEFLFNMSHDIRTPMNAIVGFTDLIEKHYDDKERCMDYIHKTQQSNKFLLSLINDVLEMSRIESGNARLELTVSSVGSVAREMSAIFEDQMQKKGIKFEREIATHTKWAFFDRAKVREIYLNILSNALKYTPEGGCVSMKVTELASEKAGFTNIEIVIADNGLGMSKDFLPHLFEAFSRESTSTKSRQQGTGLGMSIVKHIVDMMDGTIEVESELGKGTVFKVIYPLKIEGAEPVKTEEKSIQRKKNCKGKRVLLAEDNDLNAEIAIEILTEAGFAVERASDGQICLNMLQLAENNYYDLILMDIQMPNMNGYEATKAIRGLEDSVKANIKILAMTANAFEEDRKEALKMGMNGHLAKPINPKQLINTLYEMIE